MRAQDVDPLHALLGDPDVNRYLVDGRTPRREAVVGLLEKSDADFAAAGIGVWMLEAAPGAGAGYDVLDARPAGCVRLDLDAPARVAELTYLLAPGVWGRGLATRMGATALDAAFASGAVDRVWAGADGPNARSIAVIERLGLRLWRHASCVLGPGVEYDVSRDDWSARAPGRAGAAGTASGASQSFSNALRSDEEPV